MTAQLKSSFHISLEKVPRIASMVVFVVGCIVLTGWQLDLPALTSILPGMATMKANSALAFILCAISLWSLQNRQTKRSARLLANACAAVVLLIAVLTLGEYLSNQDFGIDQLLFQDHAAVTGTSFPGRMSPTTALNFLLISCALLLIDNRWSSWPNQSLTLTALIIASVAVIGYIYGVSSLYKIGAFASMALHTAITFIILSLGILCARPNRGLMSSFTGEGAAGILARRLLPAAIIVPILLGWLRLLGQQMGLYDTAFGTALLVLANVLIFSALIWWNAHMLQWADVERREAEKALMQTELRSRALIENSRDGIALFAADGTILYGSPSTVQILGYSLDDFIGRNAFELIHEADHASVTERLTMSLQQPGAHIPVNARVRHKDGVWRWLDGIFTNLLDDPSVQAIVNNYQDITERKRDEDALHASESRKSAIIESSLDALITIDHLGHILEFNPAAQEVFGYTESQAVGKEMAELIVPPSLREQHRRGMARYLSTGEAKVLGKRIEITGMRADGTEFPVELAINRIKGEEPPVFTGFIRDISRRKLTEDTLLASEERFRLVVEAAPSAMIAVKEDGKINLVNEKAQELFGYPAEELLGRPVEMLVPERFRSGHSNHRQNFLVQPTSRAMGVGRDLFGLHKDGHEIPIEIGLTPYESSEGQLTLALIVDITERSQAEEKIAYQAYLLENVNDAVIGSDENSYIRFWNQGAERMFGWKAEEVLGRSAREILRSEFINTDRESVFKILAEQGRWKGDAILYHKDGSQVTMEVSSITLRDTNGMITGYVSVNRDIAERKQAEADLYKSEELLRLGYDTAKLGIWQNNLVTGMVHFDERARAHYGFDADNVPLADVIARVHPDDVDRLGQEIATTTDPASDGRYGTEYRVIHSDGSVHWLAVQAHVYFQGEGNSRRPVTGFGTSQDITERKQAEEEIRELNEELNERVVKRTAALSQANALLQMLLDQMPDHIYFKDAQSRFIRNSKSQAKALGLSDSAEAVGKSDFDFFPHAQISYETEQEIIRSGKALVDVEEQVVWPDGKETWVSTTKAPLLDQAGQIIGTFGISRDITERKHSEEALQKAKLELEAANRELEAFSYSVSHDLRAPLRSVDGFSQALLEDYGDLLPPEGRNFLERVRSSAQRMALLIDDLLNLSRVTRVALKLVSVDLTRIAENIAAELRRAHPEQSVKFIIARNLNVRGDPHLLQVVLENFLSNAWKFTSKQEKPEIEFGSKRENNETVYFVRDNGAGFDMAYASKLFGAFQRLHTMTEFPGTGIGLATVQRIIHRHGGRVWAEGAVDKGATFFFTVPPLESVQPKAETKERDTLSKRIEEII